MRVKDRRQIDRRFSVDLAASAGEVAQRAFTMAGVNDELRPFVRMSTPAAAKGLSITDAPVGEVLFRSWLLAWCVFPFDRHALRLESVVPGEGFVEESTSYLQRRWHHDRQIWALPTGGCRVQDHLVVAPRVGLTTPLVAAIVTFLFRHRHRRLRRRFGFR